MLCNNYRDHFPWGKKIICSTFTFFLESTHLWKCDVAPLKIIHNFPHIKDRGKIKPVTILHFRCHLYIFFHQVTISIKILKMYQSFKAQYFYKIKKILLGSYKVIK